MYVHYGDIVLIIQVSTLTCLVNWLVLDMSVGETLPLILHLVLVLARFDDVLALYQSSWHSGVIDSKMCV